MGPWQKDHPTRYWFTDSSSSSIPRPGSSVTVIKPSIAFISGLVILVLIAVSAMEYSKIKALFREANQWRPAIMFMGVE